MGLGDLLREKAVKASKRQQHYAIKVVKSTSLWDVCVQYMTDRAEEGRFECILWTANLNYFSYDGILDDLVLALKDEGMDAYINCQCPTNVHIKWGPC